jgi:hypothetical protein
MIESFRHKGLKELFEAGHAVKISRHLAQIQHSYQRALVHHLRVACAAGAEG